VANAILEKLLPETFLFNVLKNKSFSSGEGVIQQHIINPTSLTVSELFGTFVENSSWSDGAFSSILRQQVTDYSGYVRWIVFDGQADNSWLECLNPVLNDSRHLTLTNGERIEVKSTTSFIFESDSLTATIGHASQFSLFSTAISERQDEQ
jgi:dynein heavy chain